MSREILFRGKRTDNGEWVEGYFVKGEWYFDKKEIYALLPLDLCFFPRCEISEWVEVDSKTVCQYAGIRTYKNGRKIFEGDIIKVNDFWTGVVVWEFNDTSFEVEPIDHMEAMESLGVVVNGNKVEVIGNIFDNPELLEGE